LKGDLQPFLDELCPPDRVTQKNPGKQDVPFQRSHPDEELLSFLEEVKVAFLDKRQMQGQDEAAVFLLDPEGLLREEKAGGVLSPIDAVSHIF
jgi:hypothetical protein